MEGGAGHWLFVLPMESVQEERKREREGCRQLLLDILVITLVLGALTYPQLTLSNTHTRSLLPFLFLFLFDIVRSLSCTRNWDWWQFQMLTFVPPAITGTVSPKEIIDGVFSTLFVARDGCGTCRAFVCFHPALKKKSDGEREERMYDSSYQIQSSWSGPPILMYPMGGKGAEWEGREPLSCLQGTGEGNKQKEVKRTRFTLSFPISFFSVSFLFNFFSYIPIQLTDDPRNYPPPPLSLSFVLPQSFSLSAHSLPPCIEFLQLV